MEAMMDCRSNKVPKHTPGPWEYHKMPQSGYIVFQTWDVPTAGHVKTEADARLIAAAPEMLQTLKLFYDWSKNGTKYPPYWLRTTFVDKCSEIIAKAEGRTP
jgi:hypothetical protein